MVVVAEAQALASHPGAQLVQLTGERPHALGVGEPGRWQVRDDDGVRAEGAGGAHDSLGVLTRGRRVHAAHGQARRVQLGPQSVRVNQDAERFYRAVAEGSDVGQDFRPADGHLIPEGVELQGRRVGSQGFSFSKNPRFPLLRLNSSTNQVNSHSAVRARYC